MRFIKKFSISLIIFTMLMNSFFIYILAQEDNYYVSEVKNGNIEKIETFFDFGSANTFYLNNVKDYDNLLLLHDDEVIKMEYGIVEFVTNDEGNLNIGYISTDKNTDSSINGSYGIDGAYLYSNYDCTTVYFKISGDVGYTSLDDVILHPYGLTNNRLSVYKNMNGSFCHLIKTQFIEDYYSTVLAIDDNLEFLENDKDYYSYDGHYFYENFITMIDDYVEGNYDNAINSENPYYNYYEYLPYRSLTNYNSEEIESYYKDTLNIKDKLYYYVDNNDDGANDIVNRSQFIDEFKTFVTCQNIYGANALLLISTSSYESSQGKSYSAFNNNNLFADAAYESKEEKDNNRYDFVANSIYSYAKYYVSNKYSNYRSESYYGNFVGNKLSGINSNNKKDAYWGERVASEYYKIDSKLGYKDKNSYCLGIIDNTDGVIIYKDEELKTRMMSIDGIKDYSLIILEEKDNVYKVQVDPSFHSEFKYDFIRSVGYISKHNISTVLNKEKIHNNELVDIKLDTDDGTIFGNKNINLKNLKGSSLSLVNPNKDGYEFTSYKIDKNKDNESTTYKANYRKIEDISIKTMFDTDIFVNDGLNLTNSSISIKYGNGISKDIPITTSMIRNFNPYLIGEQTITINYCGLSIDVNINVEENKKVDEAIKLIEKNISSYLSDEVYNTSDIKKIKANLSDNYYLNSFEEIRLIDAMLLDKYRDNVYYRIDDNDYDISVSGLTLSLADASVTSWFKPFTDTYYVHINNVSNFEKKALENISSAYGFEVVDCINISYALNMKKIEQSGSMIISLNVKNKENNKIYTVYRIDENGDIVKCKTIQTNNKIEFITEKSGSFAILTKDGVNKYNFEDYYENITIHNSDPDNHKSFLIGLLLMVVIVFGFVVVVIYYRTENKKIKLWKDYKKSLQKAESVQEEKPKN